MTDFDPDKLKHKPNEKHTLDEVLKSLQDLIHNDLLRDRGQPSAVDAPPAPEAAGEAPPAADGPAPTVAPSADMPFGAVVASLEQLVTRDLAPGDDSMDGGRSGLLPSRGTTPSLEGGGTTPRMEDDRRDAGGRASSGTNAEVERRLEQLPRATPGDSRDGGGRAASGTAVGAVADGEPAAAEPAPVPAKGADTGQQAFAFDDHEAAAPDIPAVEAPLEAPPMEAEPTPPAEPEVEEISLDAADLPVLNDPVLDTEPPAPPADVDGIPVLEDVALAPPPDDPAGAIAERVVARLNAERRERGEPELDAATGDALRALLRDEFERTTPGREEVGGVGNKPPNPPER